MTPEEKAELWNRVVDPILGRPMHYRLIGQSVQPASLGDWATTLEHEDRRVRKTRIGPFEVSTVFLGLDHNFSSMGPPILFETMTFLASPHRENQTLAEHAQEIDADGMNDEDGRTCTWSEAEAMHQRAVNWIVAHFAVPGEEPVEITGEEASTVPR